MSVYTVIDKLEATIKEGVWLPFGARMVSQDRLLDLVEKLRSTLPDEVTRAKAVTKQKDQLIDDAKSQAASMLDQATTSKTQMLSEAEITRQAQEQAARVLADAEKAGARGPSRRRRVRRRRARVARHRARQRAGRRPQRARAAGLRPLLERQPGSARTPAMKRRRQLIDYVIGGLGLYVLIGLDHRRHAVRDPAARARVRAGRGGGPQQLGDRPRSHAAVRQALPHRRDRHARPAGDLYRGQAAAGLRGRAAPAVRGQFRRFAVRPPARRRDEGQPDGRADRGRARRRLACHDEAGHDRRGHQPLAARGALLQARGRGGFDRGPRADDGDHRAGHHREQTGRHALPSLGRARRQAHRRRVPDRCIQRQASFRDHNLVDRQAGEPAGARDLSRRSISTARQRA